MLTRSPHTSSKVPRCSHTVLLDLCGPSTGHSHSQWYTSSHCRLSTRRLRLPTPIRTSFSYSPSCSRGDVDSVTRLSIHGNPDLRAASRGAWSMISLPSVVEIYLNAASVNLQLVRLRNRLSDRVKLLFWDDVRNTACVFCGPSNSRRLHRPPGGRNSPQVQRSSPPPTVRASGSCCPTGGRRRATFLTKDEPTSVANACTLRSVGGRNRSWQTKVASLRRSDTPTHVPRGSNCIPSAPHFVTATT
jgi:hypothetical protein